MSSQDPYSAPSDPHRPDGGADPAADRPSGDRPASDGQDAGHGYAAPSFGQWPGAAPSGPSAGQPSSPQQGGSSSGPTYGQAGSYGQAPQQGADQSFGQQPGPGQYGQPGYGQPSFSQQGAGQPYGQQPGPGQGQYGQQPGHGHRYTAQGNYGQATFQQSGQPLNSSDARTWALVSHIAAPVLNFVTVGWVGFVAPLVLWFVFKDRDPLVRNAAAGAFNFNLIVLVLNVAIWIFGILTLGIGLILLVIPWVLSIVFAIIGAVKASRGEAYKYPIQIPVLS